MIAASSPASTQWCRKTLLSTGRVCGASPKDTLDTPSTVSTPGKSRLMARMPSMVSCAEFDPLRLTGCEREGERIEDQLIGGQREFVASEVVNPAGDLDLAIGSPRHALLVDGQRDDAGAVVAHRRQHRVAADASVLEIDAVDDAASRVDLERRLDDVGVGAVDDQRRVDAHLQRLDDGAHLLRLVAALCHRDAQVERMRAAFDLRPGDAQDAVVVVGEEQALDRARSLSIDPLTDEQWCRLLTQVDGVHAACQARFHVRRHLRPRRRATRATSSRICSGVDPQQPPTTLTPYSLTKLASSVAMGTGCSG